MLVGITGGTGFVGKELVLRCLDTGDTVRLLSRRSANDIVLPDAVQMFHGDLSGSVASLVHVVDGVSLLYHCAGECIDTTSMHSVDAQGTAYLCDADARRSRV